MSKRTIVITEDDGVVRVDKFLATLHPEYSRAALAKLFTLNLIKLNGSPIQPGHKLRPGGELEYDLGPLQQAPEVIDLPIVYEDKDVVVINKPAGVISHARGRFWQEASVASFLRDHVLKQEQNTKSDDVLFDKDPTNTAVSLADAQQSLRAGIVHRLDRATSGIMICAKNKHTYTFLQSQFADRTTEKKYIAVLDKLPKQPEAQIVAPIARNPKDPKTFYVHPSGKPAETHYRILADDSNALLLTPKTGRTHQLRVHLSYIDRPIVGDVLYGGKKNERLLLHAYSLTIEIRQGQKMTFTAPVPDEFGIRYEDLQ